MEVILKYKKNIIIGLIFIGIISTGSYYIFKTNKKNKVVVEEGLIKKEEIKEEPRVEIEVVKEYSVDIKGEVNNPGVYKLPKGSLVIDVINVAGGLKKYANTKCINLSKLITNEMVIYIHSNSEVNKKTEEIKNKEVSECICPELKNDAYTTNNNTNVSSKININTATSTELQTLSGVGESRANDIINYRTSNGNFKTIEDIKNVSGIGDSIFNKIKDLITV